MEVYEPTEEEKESFKEACAPCYEDIKKSIGDDRYNAIMDEIERISAKQ